MVILNFNWNYFWEDVRDFVSEHKGLIFGVVMFVVLIPVFIFIFKIFSAADESYEEPKREHGQALTTNPKLKRNMGILLLGLDKENGGAQRADSIIVVMYNAKENKAETIRIPRDLYVEMDDYKGKINGLYEKKGVDGMMSMVSEYIGIPITHFVKTDFDGLTNIIDNIGGIELDSEIEINNSNNKQVGKDIHVNKGHVELDGKEALAYSRIRYIDNDIKRGERQQQVIKAIAHKLTQPENLPNLANNLEGISPYVKSNIKISDVTSRMSSVSNQPDMEKLDFKWDSFDYKKQSYVKISRKERDRISEELRSFVGLNPITLKPIVTDPTDQNEVDEVRSELSINEY